MVQEHSCDRCNDYCYENVTFLQGLSEKQREKILCNSTPFDLKNGDVLFNQDERVEYIYIIKSGRVKLSNFDKDGREQIIGIFSDNDTIWEGLFTDNKRFPYSGVCISQVSGCKLHRRDFEEAVSDVNTALNIIRLLSQKLHDANERNRVLSTGSPKARIAGFLLYRMERSSSDVITHRLDDIAASISARPETVSRKLKELEHEQIISRVGQSGIRINNIERLREIFES